jgi:adenosylhomocysteinase
VNDSKTKKEFDNYYGIQQSILSALDIAANVQLRGKTIVIAGYGPVGKGCAEILSSLGAKIIVTEIDSFRALQALMSGYDIKRMEDAAEQGNIFITATGCVDVITKEHFYKMKSGAILCNAGHGDNEFNMRYLRENNVGRVKVNEYLDEYKLSNGNRIRVICDGFLANMRICSGNPPLGMSITFSNHILAQMRLFSNPEEYRMGQIYSQPASTELEVIELVFPDLSRALTKLTPSQACYLGRAA